MSNKNPMEESNPVFALFNKTASNYDTSGGGVTHELAQQIVELACADIQPGAVILDNAAGTGVVIRQLLRSLTANSDDDARRPLPGKILCVDGAEGMVAVAKEKVGECIQQLVADNKIPSNFSNTIAFETLPAENLSMIPSNTITHSFTSLGIFIFTDPIAATAELYRTLKPSSSSIAIITTWKRLGFVEVMNEAQRILDPDLPMEQLFKAPFAPEWFTKEKLAAVMKEGGFRDVRVEKRMVHYADKSKEELVDGMYEMLPMQILMEGWEMEKKEKFRGVSEEVVGRRAKVVERDGMKLLGLETEAWVGVGRKVEE